MANRKISELSSRTPALSDLMLVGDPSSGYSYKCTVTALATIIETDIADGYVTLGTTQTISGAKTFSNNLTLTSVANAATTQTKFLTLNGSNVVNYRTGAEVLSDIGGQASLSGTGLVKSTSGTISYITDNSSNWNTAYNDSIVSAAVTGTTTKTLTLTQQDSGTITASWTDDNSGTVTSVGLSTGTTGTDINVSGSPITSSGTITLNIPTASATNRGALSSTDWSTFNNKQNALTLTTTGTSGAATLVGSTLNIPQYQSVLTNPVTGTGTTNYIPKFTSSSAIGNSVMQEVSSDIGIGMIPVSGYKLNVNGLQRNEGANTVLNFGELDANNIYFQALNNAGNASKGFVWFGTAERMRLDASGNLGLGVTPSAWSGVSSAFELNGNAYIYSTTGVISIGANAYFNGTNWIYKTTQAATRYEQVNGLHQWSNAPSGTAGNAISFTQAMTLDASGRLGLGTSSPTQKLSIKADGSNNGLISYQTSAGTTTSYIGVPNANGDVVLSSTTNDLVIRNDAGNILFAYSNVERMRLNSSGELLINTTTDVGDYKLQVSGNVYASGSSSATQFNATSKYTWGTATTGTTGQIATDNTNNYFDYLGNLYFRGAAASNNLVTFLSSGNVGIGTTSPAVSLDIANSARIQGTGNAASGAGLEFAYNGTNGLIGAYDRTNSSYKQLYFYASNTIFENGGSERMRITSGGDIGIGTSSPFGTTTNRTVLSVNGTTDVALNVGTGGSQRAYLYASSTYADLGTIGSLPITFSPANSERMRITAGGNVLIGTTTDAGYKLDVNGTGRLLSTSSTAPNSATGLYLGWGSSPSNYNGINFQGAFATDVYFGRAVSSDDLVIRTSGGEKIRFTTAGAATFSSSVTTGAPSGGNAAAWKLGERVASSSLTLNTTQYIQLDINGTLYTLATVNLS